MFFSCLQKAKQSYFLGKQIDDLAVALSSYINREADFPYSRLYELHSAIEQINNIHVKISLLKRLNNEVIGGLFQHNPKLHSMYIDVNDRIAELNMEAIGADSATQVLNLL